MIINFALWSDPALFGNFGSDLRDLTNPSLTAITSGGEPISWLPDIPFFEGTVLLILIAGIVYYAVAARGRAGSRRGRPRHRRGRHRLTTKFSGGGDAARRAIVAPHLVPPRIGWAR